MPAPPTLAAEEDGVVGRGNEDAFLDAFGAEERMVLVCVAGLVVEAPFWELVRGNGCTARFVGYTKDGRWEWRGGGAEALGGGYVLHLHNVAAGARCERKGVCPDEEAELGG